MKHSILILIILISISVFGQSTIKSFEGDDFECTYHINEGRFNGTYTSYYKDGKKKAEGKFENNLRVGAWTMWDAEGEICVERTYTSPFSFKGVVPKVSNLETTQYKLTYNKDGYIKNFKVEESMVVWHKRIWRYSAVNENPLLFKNERLFTCLEKNIGAKNIRKYTSDNDEFQQEDSTVIPLNHLEIIGYKTKEDCFFDNKRFVSETRIIGICPVGINTQTNDTVDLYWVYFPEVRKYLAQEKINAKEPSEKVKTLDDLFFFRNYTGTIYKESNLYDENLLKDKDPQTIAKASKRIDLNAIEHEHNLWQYYAKEKSE